MRRFLFGVALALLLALKTGAAWAEDPPADPGAGPTSQTLAVGPATLTPGVWQTVCQLLTPRSNFSATLLDNGKILLAGGTLSSSNAISSATKNCELFDPATWTTTAAAPLNQARFFHSAIKLADGRVLVAGGQGPVGGNYMATCEIYDPATDSWTATGSQRYGSYQHKLVALDSGKILKACGHSIPVRICELYDPASGTWTQTGSTPFNHSQGANLVKLADGHVAAVNGATNTIEIYNPALGTWTTSTPRTTRALRDGCAALGEDGKIRIVGGAYIPNSTTFWSKAVNYYNPVDDTLTTGTSMVMAREKFRLVMLEGGDMLAIGGTAGQYNYLTQCEYYNKAEDAWRPMDSLDGARAMFETVTVGGVVYVFGGTQIAKRTDGVVWGMTRRSVEALVPQVPAPITDSKPVAIDDYVNTTEDTNTNFQVLSNDYDLDNDPLEVSEVTAGVSGQTAIRPDGQVRYTPNANFSGKDTFAYAIRDDDGNTTVGAVTVTISPVNDKPVAADDAFSVDEDTTLDILQPGVMRNDTEYDAEPMTALLQQSASHGSLTFRSDGSFTYRPETNYNSVETSYAGPDRFSYIAKDPAGNSSNVAWVDITVNPVNDLPVANSDFYSMYEDATLTRVPPGVMVNDYDVEKNPLRAQLLAPPAHGTVALNGDGSFTYRPETNYNNYNPETTYGGPYYLPMDSFTYRVAEVVNGVETNYSNATTASIQVRAVNDAPVGVNNHYITMEDTRLSVAAPGVLGNDTDYEGHPITAVLYSAPYHGGLEFSANGSFTYTPETNYHGVDVFVYQPRDVRGALGNKTTVFLDVASVNDPPVAEGESYSVDEDTALEIAAPGLLGNETDYDADPMLLEVVQGPEHGRFTLTEGGGFRYEPETNFNGTDLITYVVSDDPWGESMGPVMATITVNPVNDAPAVGAIALPATPFSVGRPVAVSASFTDPDAGDAHTAVWNWGDGTTSAGTIDPATGGVAGEHAYSAAGFYTVTLTVTDQAGAQGASSSSGATPAFLVIYDPQAGSITGNGWINSPAGASTTMPNATGKATFALEALYARGSQTPGGKILFEFPEAGMKFQNGSLEWLVVTGDKAFIKGQGSMKGDESGYGFLISTVDSKVSGALAGDRLRIKIWKLSDGQVAYDNQAGAPLTAEPTMVIGGGDVTLLPGQAGQ